MKKLTFKAQIWLGAGIFLLCLVLSHVLHMGWLHNVGWILYGLLFIINPVPPENVHSDPKKLQRYARIAGVIAVLWGLLVRYRF